MKSKLFASIAMLWGMLAGPAGAVPSSFLEAPLTKPFEVYSDDKVAIYVERYTLDKEKQTGVFDVLFDYPKGAPGEPLAVKSNRIKLHVDCAEKSWNFSNFQTYGGNMGTGFPVGALELPQPDPGQKSPILGMYGTTFTLDKAVLNQVAIAFCSEKS